MSARAPCSASPRLPAARWRLPDAPSGFGKNIGCLDGFLPQGRRRERRSGEPRSEQHDEEIRPSGRDRRPGAPPRTSRTSVRPPRGPDRQPIGTSREPTPPANPHPGPPPFPTKGCWPGRDASRRPRAVAREFYGLATQGIATGPPTRRQPLSVATAPLEPSGRRPTPLSTRPARRACARTPASGCRGTGRAGTRRPGRRGGPAPTARATVRSAPGSRPSAACAPP